MNTGIHKQYGGTRMISALLQLITTFPFRGAATATLTTWFWPALSAIRQKGIQYLKNNPCNPRTPRLVFATEESLVVAGKQKTVVGAVMPGPGQKIMSFVIEIYGDTKGTKMEDDMFEVPRHVLDELRELRKAMREIHEMAQEDVRTGKADGTFLYQIEATSSLALTIQDRQHPPTLASTK